MTNRISGDNSTIPLKNITFTIPYDNNPLKKILSSDWSFSCMIEGAQKTILFVTGGNSKILLRNMKKIGINSEEIISVVLSHSHNLEIMEVISNIQELGVQYIGPCH